MSKSTVAVIDYGMGNLHSVASALQHVNANVDVIVTGDADKILAADRVVFPGVGAIRDCMAEIRKHGIDEVVAEVAKTKPLLAVCVGMQALMNHSEENGGVDCLGMVDGDVKFLGRSLTDADGSTLKVPHMGWNQVQRHHDHPLWNDIDEASRFYFVHSYYVSLKSKQWLAASTDYGVPIHAVLSKDNIFATQFHPEKSSRPGLALLKNFLQWDGQS
ncbi:imidazole glycerol phosphate synthase subunit HisH [bacterium]|nr:imidazole glycerol phosphate synthase subunit HisH [bacterium]